MGDLISRSALIEAISKSTCNWAEHLWKQVVCDVIYNQPTAYDVEKVVAELEEEINRLCSASGNYFHGYTEGIEKAIEIVRKGGV